MTLSWQPKVTKTTTATTATSRPFFGPDRNDNVNRHQFNNRRGGKTGERQGHNRRMTQTSEPVTQLECILCWTNLISSSSGGGIALKKS